MKNRIDMKIATTQSRRGVITRKKGSRKLYVDFRYRGKRIERSTGLVDTPENKTVLREWLDRVMDKIDEGTFRFEDAFPDASEKDKNWFAKQEGREYRPKPHQVLIGDYLGTWLDEVVATFPSANKRRDYGKIVEGRIRPYFAELTFHQLNRVEVRKFIGQLRYLKEPKKGEMVSRAWARNVLIPLRTLFEDACDEYHWDLPDPFRNLHKHLPQSRKVKRTVFRFEQWQQLLEHLEPHYHPVAEIMIMTGMIASEVAGLKRTDLTNDEIIIRHARVKGQDQESLKTVYRHRRIPITQAIRQRLDHALAQTEGDYVFTMANDRPFHEGSFRSNAWTRAFKAAGMDYKVPYTMRHSYVAWALTLRMDPNRLVKLMGHSSKKMIYDTYGDYVEGLELDAPALFAYFGRDFLGPKTIATLAWMTEDGESFGESHRLQLVK
ncbi:DUF3596 domain-containing protein [Deltaproteobacteria bacterium IMCC39524]|nr:DUF3596 domain-containing protein [Deltaproteobacteria bacterium IMCC39524]